MLKEKLKSLIRERFAEFTPAQKQAIPPIEKGENVLLIAPTGLGKTESALLPIFERLIDYEDKTGVQALYITPLRALNRDMLARIEWWCEKLGITYAVRHGDTPQYQRAKISKKPPQILITTPESLQAMLPTGRMSQALCNTRHIVVDEVHAIFSNKRGCQLALAMERLKENIRAGQNQEEGSQWRQSGAGVRSLQIIGLSATVGDAQEAANWLFGASGGKAVRVDYPRPVGIEICECRPKAEDAGAASRLFIDDKAAARLREIMARIRDKKVLIFVNTRHIAENLSSRLIASGAKVAVHHGSLAKEARLKAEDDFRKGRLDALVCTSSLELGIDIGDVTDVIQYMSPRQSGRLLQRIGRSGHRIGLVPSGIILPADEDDLVESVAIAKAARENYTDPEKMESGALDVVAHEITGVCIAREGTVKLEELHSLFSKSPAYGIGIEGLAKAADALAGARLISYSPETGLVAKNAGTRNYYYSHLSTIPKSKKYRITNTESNKQVAMLDEAFAATLEVGAGFISRGIPWVVTGIHEDEIFVEQSQDLALSPPDWSGDELPVSCKIAREVASLREQMGKAAWKKESAQFGSIPEPYKIEGLFAEAKNIVIEARADTAVINTCMGTRINTTIGRCLAIMLGMRHKRQPYVMSDPYRIIIKSPRPLKAADVKDAFLEIGKNAEWLLWSDYSNWGLFRYKLNHVARAFGVLSDDATIGKAMLAMLEKSAVFDETKRAVSRQYLDMEGAQGFYAAVSRGEFIVHAHDTKSFSRISELGLMQVRALELLEPVQPYSTIVDSFRKGILSKMLKFECTYCKKVSYYEAAKLGEKIACQHCKSPLVALVGDSRVRAEKKMSKDERMLSASLIEAYGKRGAWAMTAFGVGPKTAARVLGKLRKEDELFFADLLEAQKQFIRTKKYWSA
ncbi:MAG: DEAD/DEAH box helicase [Candidatus Micrarchaeia archaeon]